MGFCIVYDSFCGLFGTRSFDIVSVNDKWFEWSEHSGIQWFFDDTDAYQICAFGIEREYIVYFWVNTQFN